MPRRSSRIRTRNNDDETKESEMEIDAEPTKITTTNKSAPKSHESASNASKNEQNIEIEQKDESPESSVGVTSDVKRLSIDPNTVIPSMVNKEDIDDNDIAMDNIAEETSNHSKYNSEDEPISDHEAATLASSRVRRSNRAQISYREESSDDDLASSSEDDDDDPLFVGLSKVQKAELKEKMSGMQNNYTDSVRKERELKLQEIICSFDFNIGAKVTLEEAGFIYDFCTKHQYDVNDKIEDEGDFFLCSMREMMEEKLKLVRAGVKNTKKKRRHDDSDSEFDCDDYDDSDDDSEFSFESDCYNPLVDNENMISDDDEFDHRNRKRAKRNKNVWRDPKDGREYHAIGRLLLDDALKDTTNFEGWSAARVKAFKNKEVNPNAYHYRFNDVGEAQKNGPVLQEEHETFMKRVMEVGVNVHWGTFSMKIPGRVGYQCSNYWRQMMKDSWVKDPNYWIRSDGSFQFKRAKKGSIPDSVRRFSFVVLKDPSKVFDPIPGSHPKRPSDKSLKKYLESDVRQLTAKEKKGGKRKKAKQNTKNEEKEEEQDESTNNKKEEDEDDSNNEENTNNKEKDTKKKKKSKKEDDGESDEEESKKSKTKKKSKKDKKGKKKKKSKKKNGKKKKTEEDESESKQSKKRKRNEDNEASELEPPQKKRKLSKDINQEKDKKGSILDELTDIMTGEKLVNPAMSEYGHVMEYSSWCSILRNKRTKNQCPFTKQSVTRRSLIKLNADNIEEYKDKIVNISAEDMEKLRDASS